MLYGVAAAALLALVVRVVRVLRPVHVPRAEQHVQQAQAHETAGRAAAQAVEAVGRDMTARSKRIRPLAVKAATLPLVGEELQEISRRDIQDLGNQVLAQELDLEKLQASQRVATAAFLASIEDHKKAEDELRQEIQRQAAIPRLTTGKVVVIGGVAVVVTAVVILKLK